MVQSRRFRISGLQTRLALGSDSMEHLNFCLLLGFE